MVISRHQALTSNAGEEVRSMRAIKAIGIDRTRELLYFQGGNPRFELDAAIDPKTFPDNVLELYTAFRAGIEFRPEDVLPEFRGARPQAQLGGGNPRA